jgi:hypothetical protein
MKQVTRVALAAGLMLGLAGTTASAQMYVYPQQGQSPEQTSRDRGDCHMWAVQQVGYDPTMSGPSAQAQTRSTGGGMLKGAAVGAAGGAAIGAIAGDAGKGAAIGALGGGLINGMRRHDQNQQAQAQANAYNQQQDAARQEYQRALGACLEGRGYTVR